MSVPQFDLRHRPWIPIVDDGAVRLVGLRELLLRADEIEDLAVPVPPVEAGLWRILYAVTARIAGLDSRVAGREEWADTRYELAEAGAGFTEREVDGYLDAYADRWDLFDPVHPWGQDPRLREQCPKSAGVNKLAFSRPSGQNPVWFGHYTDADPVALPVVEAAWALVAQLYFGAAGRCSSRTVLGRTEANSTAGPLRGTVSFHPIGRNLLESLLAGLPAPDSSDAGRDDQDVCPWERDEPRDPLGRPCKPTSPGGLLTGRARTAVLLVPDQTGDQVVDAYVTWAWRQDAPPARDPYLIQRLSQQQTWYDQPAQATRAVWRDLDALLLKTRPGSQTAQPLVFANIGDLPMELIPRLRVRALGFDQDRQAKDHQWFSGTTPPVLGWLEEHNADAALVISRAHDAAERVARSLRTELRRAWAFVTSPPSRGDAPSKGRSTGPWAGRAESLYWSRAEPIFWDLADATDMSDPPLPRFVRLAQAVADEVMAGQDRMKTAKAAARAQRGLGALLKGSNDQGNPGQEIVA